MNLLLDTTYFLPLIGISIKDIPQDAIIKLIERNHRILLSEISLFELLAKGAKYISLGSLSSTRVSKGVRSILYDERIDKIPIYDSSILATSFKLREMLHDYIDCLILSSAIYNADILVTEDSDIYELYDNENFQGIISGLNPRFKVESIKDLI